MIPARTKKVWHCPSDITPKELLAIKILKYIEHARRIYDHAYKGQHYNDSFKMALYRLVQLENLCRNQSAIDWLMIKNEALKNMHYLEAILPAPRNNSFQSSIKNLNEIQKNVQK